MTLQGFYDLRGFIEYEIRSICERKVPLDEADIMSTVNNIMNYVDHLEGRDY